MINHFFVSNVFLIGQVSWLAMRTFVGSDRIFSNSWIWESFWRSICSNGFGKFSSRVISLRCFRSINLFKAGSITYTFCGDWTIFFYEPIIS